MTAWTRRDFLKTSTAAAAALSAGPLAGHAALGADKPGSKMRMGLVTYLWGQDWELPTLIANCEKSGQLGVETRTQHAHGVEPTLSAAERREVKKRFADSPVELLGPGTNQDYDDPENPVGTTNVSNSLLEPYADTSSNLQICRARHFALFQPIVDPPPFCPIGCGRWEISADFKEHLPC